MFSTNEGDVEILLLMKAEEYGMNEVLKILSNVVFNRFYFYFYF
jgi:hypothetical protein